MAEANPPEAQGKEKKEEKGTLESVIDELWSFGRKAIMIGAIFAMPYTYGFIEPTHIRNAQVVSYSLAASRATSNLMEEKPALEGTVRNSFNGLLLSYPTAKAFGALNSLEPRIAAVYGNGVAKLAKIGAWTFGAQPALATANTALNYGLGQKFRKELWPRVKITFKYLGLLGGLNAAYISQFGLFPQMVAASTLWYAFGLLQSKMGGKGSIKNLFTALNPIPYLGATASVTYKIARNTTKGLFDAVYAIGSGLRDTLYKTSPKTAAPRQEPAKAQGS